MALTKIPKELLVADVIDGTKIADDAIDSEHYADVSIDTAHIADDQVTLAKMAGLARGKIIIGNSSGNPAALAIGSNTYVLKSDGTDIAWAADAGLSTEEVQDIAGGMFSSNTETGITATYQDGDGTIDLVVGTLNQNTTGTAATVTTAAQPAITSLGTLTTLTVDNVIINGSTIGHTGDTDLLTVASGILTVAGEVQATTLDIGGTNITATAAELNIIDGDTSATGTTLVDADRVIVNDAGTMKQVAMSDLKTYNPGKTTEEIQDTVGAMFTGNTETNVTATYQDGDGTIDLAVDEVVRKILRVAARSAFVDCTVSDDAELTVTGRGGNVVVRRVSLPVQVIPQVTYRQE